MLRFCFKNLDLAFLQTTQFDFSLSTLFVIFTSCGQKLCVNLYTLNNTLFQVLFQLLLVLFLISYFSFFVIWQYFFLTIHFKYFDFIEWFDLNSNSSNLFERSSISNISVDFSVFFFNWLSNVSTFSTKLSIIIKTWFIRINSNKVVTNLFLILSSFSFVIWVSVNVSFFINFYY